MVKRLSMLIFMGFLLFRLSGQEASYIDSMLGVIKNADNTKEKLKAYSELFQVYVYTDTVKAFSMADTAINLALKNYDNETVASILFSKGLYYFTTGNYLKTLDVYNKALGYAREAGSSFWQARLFNNIGITYAELSAHEKALENFLIALKINESIGDRMNIAKTRANLGGLYVSMRNFNDALKELQVSLNIFEEEGDREQLANTLNNIGEVYKLQQKHDEALQCHLDALNIRRELKDPKKIAISLANVGAINNTKGDYANAIFYLHQALDLIDPEFDKLTLMAVLGYVAESYIGLGRYQEAKVYLQKGLELSEELNSRYAIIRFYITLADLADITGDKDKAIFYYKGILAHRDTLYDNQTAQQIAEMRIVYDTEKKEQENSILLNELKIQKLMLKQNRFINIAAFIFLFLFIGLSITSYKSFRNKKKALEKEKELNQLRTQFISTVSHDLKTPLAGIMSSAQLLEFFSQVWNEEERKDYFNKIYNSVNHLKSLLDEVNLYGENEAYVLKFAPEMISISEECVSIVNDIRPFAGPGFEIEYTCIGGEKEVLADRKLIRHILSNLLNNAIKYSGDSKKVEFVLDTEVKDQVHFTITDYGIGIAEKDLPMIFEKFKRASNVGQIQGTGLGLSIVRHLVELHGGIVAVQSKYDGGTTVKVEIPVSYQKK